MIRKPEFQFDDADADLVEATFGISVDDLRFLQAALRVWEIRHRVTD